MRASGASARTADAEPRRCGAEGVAALDVPRAPWVWLAVASVPDLPRDDVLTSEARHAIDEWDDVEPFPWLIQEGSVRLGGYPVPALGRATSRGVAGSCRRARPSRPSLLRNVLVDRMRRSAKLHVVVVLPSKAEEFAIGPAISLRQSRIVDAIRAAARSRTPREERLHVFGLSQWNAADNAYEGIYVHAKVGIIDDLWMTIGSTNCNSQELRVRHRAQHLHRRHQADRGVPERALERTPPTSEDRPDPQGCTTGDQAHGGDRLRQRQAEVRSTSRAADADEV